VRRDARARDQQRAACGGESDASARHGATILPSRPADWPPPRRDDGVPHRTEGLKSPNHQITKSPHHHITTSPHHQMY
jgi:hypothetical protein